MTNPKKPLSIDVIGGGVSGLTTGIMLLLHGHRVSVHTKDLPWAIASNERRPPELASIHAAASVIPHSVGGGDGASIGKLVRDSMRFFHRLAYGANFGVRQQRHYELFEQETSLPPFARALAGFEALPDGDAWAQPQYHRVPKREAASKLHGWFFNAFFCEANTYLARLHELYMQLGGRLHREFITSANLVTLKGDLVINCTGAGTKELFSDDNDKLSFVRGHMVRVNTYEVPLDSEGMYFSYNYKPHPDSEVYPFKYDDSDPRACTESADVYFYPRSDCWLLGGSRQEQYEDGTWEEEAVRARTYRKVRWSDRVPRPIWELNRELILAATKQDISRFRSTSYVGYRFVRKSGVRLEVAPTTLGSRTIVHNYGHGGAGYTISWGCALEVARLVAETFGHPPSFFPHAESDNSLGRLAMHLSDLCEKFHREQDVELHTDADDEESI